MNSMANCVMWCVLCGVCCVVCGVCCVVCVVCRVLCGVVCCVLHVVWCVLRMETEGKERRAGVGGVDVLKEKQEPHI